jgi:hypothetical protein
MNRFAIALASATALAAVFVAAAPIGAHANTYACNDTHSDWTLTTDAHSDKSSFWINTPNSSVREGTYMVSEGFTIVKFPDGWLRIGSTGTGDWTIGKTSGEITCIDKTAPAVAPAAPAVTAALSSAPLTFDNGGAKVAVSLGTMPVTVIIDTGSQTLTVTETVANWLIGNGQATNAPNEKYTLANGEMKEFKSVEINTLNLAGHELHKVHANIVPDGTNMLLGLPILAGLSPKVSFDFPNAKLMFN